MQGKQPWYFSTSWGAGGKHAPGIPYSPYTFQAESSLWAVSWNPTGQRKQKGLKSRGHGERLKQPGRDPAERKWQLSLWSSFLLHSLDESSRVWTSAKGQRAFLAKRSNCGQDGPKREGSILCGNRAYQMSEWVSAGCNLILQVFSKHLLCSRHAHMMKR